MDIGLAEAYKPNKQKTLIKYEEYTITMYEKCFSNGITKRTLSVDLNSTHIEHSDTRPMDYKNFPNLAYGSHI